MSCRKIKIFSEAVLSCCDQPAAPEVSIGVFPIWFARNHRLE